MSKIIRQRRIDLRVSGPAKQVIGEAAELTGQSMARFVLHAALARAETVIGGQMSVVLSKAQMRRFLQALEAPAPDPAALKKLMQRRPRWDR